MPRIRGTGLGAGMALGTAAIIRERNGIPTAPTVPERIAIQIAQHRLSETPEIVLVARDYTTALALSSTITWAKVAAIATESAPQDAPVPPFPAVVNLSGLLSSVQDDVLMLVDAGNSFVFPDPDPMFLAQYTAEHDRIAPKRRIYLDEGHTPAQTIDGKVIQVYARIDRPGDDVRTAMDQGADGILLPYNSPIHTAPEMSQRKQMFAMIHEAAGKPLIIADVYSLPAMLQCESAVEADLTIAAPCSLDPSAPGLKQLVAEFERVENSCFDNDIPAAVPRAASLVTSLSDPALEPAEVEQWIEAVSSGGATRVVFSLDHDSLSEGVLLELETYISACTRNLLPAYVSACRLGFNIFGQNDLENSINTAVRLLIGAGAAGIILPPDTIRDAKSAIGELDSESCRELYWAVLEQAKPT